MNSTIKRQDVRKLVGKRIIAMKKDGAVVTGILRGLKGNELILEQPSRKQVRTKLFIPLVLFDLLAIGTSGGFGSSFGAPGFSGYPGYQGYYGY